MGATAQALGAATHETFAYDEDGNLLTPNFYDYHVPHALDMPPLKTGYIESPSPFTPLGTKGMGEGGGAGIHAVCAAIQDALRAAAAPIVYGQLQPVPPRLGAAPATRRASARAASRSVERVKVEGERTFDAPRATGLARAQRPGRDGDARCPASRASRSHDDSHWKAKVKVPLGLGGLRDEDRLREDRGARARVRRRCTAKGNGVGRDDEMQTSFDLSEPDGATAMHWEADVRSPARSARWASACCSRSSTSRSSTCSTRSSADRAAGGVRATAARRRRASSDEPRRRRRAPGDLGYGPPRSRPDRSRRTSGADEGQPVSPSVELSPRPTSRD